VALELGVAVLPIGVVLGVLPEPVFSATEPVALTELLVAVTESPTSFFALAASA
jgi:hypothetical protein